MIELIETLELLDFPPSDLKVVIVQISLSPPSVASLLFSTLLLGVEKCYINKVISSYYNWGAQLHDKDLQTSPTGSVNTKKL